MELMRGLAFIALLFAGSAVGAELRQAEVCGDGTTHQAGYCPAVLTSAACSATGATTGSCSATSDEADGTRYVCATSSVTALTGAEIEACSGGAAIAGSSAVETGSNSVSLSGLTTDAAHYGQIVNESPEGWYSNRLVSSSFTPVDTGGDPYNLYVSDDKSRGTIPFAVNWPTEPDTSANGTVEVFNQSQLNAAIANGTHIQIRGPGNGGAASYTLSNWGGTDRWFDMDADVVMNGTLLIGNYLTNLNHARIKITGGTINGDIIVDGGTDILIDGITQDGYSNTIGRAWEVVRFAMVNSTIVTDEYGIGHFGQGTGPWTDLILAGNSFTSGTAGTSVPIRIQYATRAVIVDNFMYETGNGYVFRIHTYSDDVWIRNNMTATTGGTNGLVAYTPNHTADDGLRTLGKVYAYDNAHYTLNGGTGIQLFDYPRFEQAVLVGNKTYSTSYSSPTSYNPFSGYTTGPAWSQSDNVVDAYASPSWPGAGVPLN